MKPRLLLIIFILLTFNIYAQTDIVDLSFRLDGLSGEKIFYYGFCEGDKVIINFHEKNGNPLKEFEISEFLGSILFQEYKTTKIENKVLNIPRTGIYRFRLSNSAFTGRICKLSIQRIATSETQNFNTNVYWRTEKDTVYVPKQEKIIITSDTSVQEIYSSIIQISSQTPINGNSNKVLMDFQLPESTMAWSFYIGVGDSAIRSYQMAAEDFTREVSDKIIAVEPLAAIALKGIPFIINNQGNDNVKYFFLDNQNAQLFINGKPFRYYKGGDVISETSQMTSPLSGKVILALVNDNTFEPISVYIKVVAIQLKQEWGTRELKEMKITENEVPYLAN